MLPVKRNSHIMQRDSSPSAFIRLGLGDSPTSLSVFPAQSQRIPPVFVPPLSRKSLRTVKAVLIDRRSSPYSTPEPAPLRSPACIVVPIVKPIAKKFKSLNEFISTSPNLLLSFQRNNPHGIENIPAMEAI